MNAEALSLSAFNTMFPDEEAARRWFERARWPDGPECPHCGEVGHAWWIGTVRRWSCGGCTKQFTVTAGTPMHKTHLPLLKWAQAIYLIVASSKGISAKKLSEMLDVHYGTAWHLRHRIRAMMAEVNPILSGVVEMDEMYAGASPRKRAKPARDHEDNPPPPANPTGRGTKRPLAFVAAERGGQVVAEIIPTHGKAAIADAPEGKLAEDAVVMTDGLPACKHPGATHTHLSVNHSDKESRSTRRCGAIWRAIQMSAQQPTEFRWGGTCQSRRHISSPASRSRALSRHHLTFGRNIQRSASSLSTDGHSARSSTSMSRRLSRSLTSAVVTRIASGNPQRSVTMLSLIPFTFFPPSMPRAPAVGVDRTLRVSATPTDGSCPYLPGQRNSRIPA